MPMELRKRKAPEPAAAPAPKKKAAPKAAAAAKAPPKATPKKPAAKPTKATKATNAASKISAKSSKEPSPFPPVGSAIALDGFGGEIETNAGEKTTLKALVDASKSGVVLFTYPKASTPGCTKQVCYFRDEYEPLTAGGLAIYGLSNDSPKANTSFSNNHKLPYPLLCDQAQTLIDAIGLKKSAAGGTTRGVFVVDKTGKVLAAEAGSPDGTVAVVKRIVTESK